MIINIAFLLPIISILACSNCGRVISQSFAMKLSTFMMFITFALFSAEGVLFYMNVQEAYSNHLFNWISMNNLELNLSIFIDQIAIIMLILVSGISFLTQMYSMRYLEEDPKKHNFISLINFFSLSMFAFVANSNLLGMFIAWEMLAFSSFLLVGYLGTQSSVISAKKVFIYNRIADLSFLAVIVIIFNHTGTLEIAQMNSYISILKDSGVFATVCGLLLISAMIKSSQLGFHPWIKEAMQAPTPASALIHSSTLVSAGVILIFRFSDFAKEPELSHILAFWGIVGALTTGLMACAQKDLKKILALSTSSQLGLMFFACAIGAFYAALFHLVTHAIFKSLMFMGVGIIVENKETRNIERIKVIKATNILLYTAMWCGALSLMGVPPFSGGFSKESIFIESLSSSSGYVSLMLVVSVITAIYTSRMMFSIFYNGRATRKSCIILAPNYKKPLIVLGIATILSSVLIFAFSDLTMFLGMLTKQENHHIHKFYTVLILLINLLFITMGIIFSFLLVHKNNSHFNKFVKKYSRVGKVIKRNLYIDNLYRVVFDKNFSRLGNFVRKIEFYVSNKVIDHPSKEIMTFLIVSSKRKKEFISYNGSVLLVGMSFILGVYLSLSILNN